MLLKDLMTPNPITVNPEDNAIMVGNILERHRISGAFVVNKSKVLGEISKECFITLIKYMGIKNYEKFKVKDIMHTHVHVMHPFQSVREAVELILASPHQIYRIPVMLDKKLEGIITRCDIAKVYAMRMKNKFRVQDLMAHHPKIIYEYTPLHEVIKTIDNSSAKRVLVMEGNKLIGILTVLDLALALFPEVKSYRGVGDVLSKMKVEEIMTPNPITVEADEDAAKAAETLVKKRFGGLPVLKNGELVGMFTTSSVINGFKHNLEILE